MSGGEFDWERSPPKGYRRRSKVPSEWLETIRRVQRQKGSLTATPTGGAGRKLGLSDPVVLSGNAIAQRIKATLGITG